MNKKQIAIALSVALTVLAGGLIVAGDNYKCTATTQECLDLMVASYKEKAWLGLEYEWEEATRSLKITQVMPRGPGLKAGFKIGDRVVALEGLAFIPENEEKITAVQKRKAPGARFTFTVLRDGKKKDLPVTLGSVPEDVVATAIGRHMLEHVSPKRDKTAKKERD